MRLARPFYRLPVRFDVGRLSAEVAALPASAWAQHPNAIQGNSSIRLISVDGVENDDVNGIMLPTPHLQRSPYLRQVLASFGVVWSRSRLLRLAPKSRVPEHADINYHWFNRVRLHIPVVTRPDVRFHCGDQVVHMAAGEAWIFDNWRLHHVENPTNEERIHLVADTSGGTAFWQLVGQGNSSAHELPYDPHLEATPMTEHAVLAPVMSPGEVDLLVLDLRAELDAQVESPESQTRLARYHGLLDSMCRDWRQLYALHGVAHVGWPQFAQLRDRVRETSRSLAEGLIVRTNRIAAHKVLEGRVLRAMLSPPVESGAAVIGRTASARLSRPVFIVAAPRSGSTLLFETLAVSESLVTLGGEAHWLVEHIPELQPGAPQVESNRLCTQHVTESIAARIVNQIFDRLRDAHGRPVTADGTVRLLEKTPKNALRIPFFDRIFPDALFIFLWREPRESLSSIMEAWRSRQWKTYDGLEGFDGPWSLLLPPGWRALNGRPLEEIAAYQWESTNRIVLDDLASMPRERWTVVRYADLIRDPKAVATRLCEFMQIGMDTALMQRLSATLPHSRFTLTPPEPDKWRRNETEIERVMPLLQVTWRRLEALR